MFSSNKNFSKSEMESTVSVQRALVEAHLNFSQDSGDHKGYHLGSFCLVSLLYSREKIGRRMFNTDSQMFLIVLRRASGEVVKEAEKEAFTTATLSMILGCSHK